MSFLSFLCCKKPIEKKVEHKYILTQNHFLNIIQKTTNRKHPHGEDLSYLRVSYFTFLFYQKEHKIEKWREFLAQVLYESNGLYHKVESYHYSTKRILQVFPKYFKTKEDASKYEYKYTLFDRVYANRMGNGDEASQDGSRYRGRGFIQLTGYNNYKKYGYLDNAPFLETMSGAWESACKFWVGNKLDLCTSIKESTRKINGGYHGLAKREQIYEHIKTIV